MSVRRLSQLQWFGLLVGGPVWFAEFLLGLGESTAQCNPASARWGLPHDAIELGLTVAGALVVGASLAASAVVFRRTAGVDEHEASPLGRIHFFAAASVLGNLVFLAIILETGIATVFDQACRQS
ncbi:MAG: hypothetical protein ABUS54_10125 [Actinomycetota bacterium]